MSCQAFLTLVICLLLVFHYQYSLIMMSSLLLLDILVLFFIKVYIFQAVIIFCPPPPFYLFLFCFVFWLGILWRHSYYYARVTFRICFLSLTPSLASFYPWWCFLSHSLPGMHVHVACNLVPYDAKLSPLLLIFGCSHYTSWVFEGGSMCRHLWFQCLSLEPSSTAILACAWNN